jgi:Brp/Blh family beta-carotene 15,15'-monooxygenase
MALCSQENHAPGAPGHMNFAMGLVAALFVCLTALSYIVPAYSEWIALALMILAGIPHGSFDLRVARARWHEAETSPVQFVALYLVCVLSMSALCVFVPTVGLSLFLLISLIHFCEGEFRAHPPHDLIRGLLFGVGAILLPIGLHVREASAYMTFFVSKSQMELYQSTLHSASQVLVVAMVVTLVIDSTRRDRLTAAVERSLCLCGWILLPPLAGFSIWFIGRHSRQHLEVCRAMFDSKGLRIPSDFAGISLLAVLGLLPFSLAFDFSDINQLFAASICLIAGLTLPHMLVSHNLRSVVGESPHSSI